MRKTPIKTAERKIKMFEITTRTECTFSVKALNTATETIYKLATKTTETALQAAYIIAQTAEIWGGDETPEEFENVHKWTETAFGMKKAMSYHHINVGKRFVEKYEIAKGKYKYHTNLLPIDYVDFTISQLIAMLPYDDFIIREEVAAGAINPSMTCKAIAAHLDYIQNGKDEEPDGETDETDETENETDGGDDAETLYTLHCDSENIDILIPEKVYKRLVKKYGNRANE